jgi:hypothetical protein
MSRVIGVVPLAALPQRGRRAFLFVGPVLLCLLPTLSACGTYYPQSVPPVAYDSTSSYRGVERRAGRSSAAARAARVAAPAIESSDAAVPSRTESGTTGAVASGARHRPTPAIGSPDWEREQQATTRDQEQLDRMMRNICRGC